MGKGRKGDKMGKRGYREGVGGGYSGGVWVTVRVQRLRGLRTGYNPFSDRQKGRIAVFLVIFS